MTQLNIELREYINMVIEEEEQDVLHEMANLGKDDHGIDDVVIWVGKANKQHGLRIKVSNLKNHWSNDDNFVIQLPSLDYDHQAVAKWIQGKVMKQILSWITLNYQLLDDFENDRIFYTRDFLNKISKI
jgi:hypothetical protein